MEGQADGRLQVGFIAPASTTTIARHPTKRGCTTPPPALLNLVRMDHPLGHYPIRWNRFAIQLIGCNALTSRD